MQYFGGKQRISKPLSEFLNSQLKDNQPFVDLFCGSCNIITKIDSNRLRIANDKHKYLIAMWKELQLGWLPPTNLTKEQYYEVKEKQDEFPYLAGFVGFGCSFAGKWWGGFADNHTGRNYCLNAYNSTLNKLKYIQDVEFYNLDYQNIIPYLYKDSMIYCDIPYKGKTGYCTKEVGEFNHEEFYNWAKYWSKDYDIYVSEYKENIPDNFKIVWEYESKKDIRNKDSEQQKTIEVLIKYIN